MPGPALGQKQRPRRPLRETWRRKAKSLPSCRNTNSLQLRRSRTASLPDREFLSLSGMRNTKPSSDHMDSTSNATFRAQLRADSHAPRRVHAAAKRSEHANPPVAQFIAARFDHDVLVAGNTRRSRWPAPPGSAARFSAALASRLWSSTSFVNATGRGMRKQFARHFADFSAELRGTPGACRHARKAFCRARRARAKPARDRARSPRCATSLRPRIMVSPVRLSKTISSSSSPTRAPFAAPARNTPYKPAIGNRAAIDHRDAPRTLRGREPVGNAIPREPRAQLGEFVRWVTARRACPARFRKQSASAPRTARADRTS